MSDGGKGSKQRPTNLDAYYFNHDLIFGKKKKAGVIDKLTQEEIQERQAAMDEMNKE